MGIEVVGIGRVDGLHQLRKATLGKLCAGFRRAPLCRQLVDPLLDSALRLFVLLLLWRLRGLGLGGGLRLLTHGTCIGGLRRSTAAASGGRGGWSNRASCSSGAGDGGARLAQPLPSRLVPVAAAPTAAPLRRRARARPEVTGLPLLIQAN